jgi:hypothetical protein
LRLVDFLRNPVDGRFLFIEYLATDFILFLFFMHNFALLQDQNPNIEIRNKLSCHWQIRLWRKMTEISMTKM